MMIVGVKGKKVPSSFPRVRKGIEGESPGISYHFSKSQNRTDGWFAKKQVVWHSDGFLQSPDVKCTKGAIELHHSKGFLRRPERLKNP